MEAGLNLHQAQECPPVSAGLKVLLFLRLQIFKPCPHPLRKETVYRPGTVLTAPKIRIHSPQRRGVEQRWAQGPVQGPLIALAGLALLLCIRSYVMGRRPKIQTPNIWKFQKCPRLNCSPIGPFKEVSQLRQAGLNFSKCLIFNDVWITFRKNALFSINFTSLSFSLLSFLGTNWWGVGNWPVQSCY